MHHPDPVITLNGRVLSMEGATLTAIGLRSLDTLSIAPASLNGGSSQVSNGAYQRAPNQSISVNDNVGVPQIKLPSEDTLPEQRE